ncbi:hypothetical protein EVAR_9459_1 [Eumeta japonica]|uniref:Secreted protein n=1 Tax=Eumeta variegata TaxID=151549 RepID=A0A4C1UD36_EUMVA|nr:hypothetical protein EVAR_9459_1 [Eumeta japonica]
MMSPWWWRVAVCACVLLAHCRALPPAALGDAVANAATSLNSMKMFAQFIKLLELSLLYPIVPTHLLSVGYVFTHERGGHPRDRPSCRMRFACWVHM